jgi:hypothetical protein
MSLITASDTVKTNTLDTLTTSANMLIGNATNTGKITIATVNTGNTNANPAISIGADAGAKTIKINNNTNSVHCSSVDLKGSTINNITATTGALSVGDGQTDGILNLGTNSARTATGVINIGSSTSLAPINIDTASTLNTNATPAISIGTAVSAKTIKIGHNASATRGIVNVGELKVDTGQFDVKLETQGTNNQMYIASTQSGGGGTLYIASAGATRSGSVNISTNAGTFATNICTGTGTGLLTIGSSSNSATFNSTTLTVNSNLTMGASKNITLKTDGTAPTAQTQLGGRVIQSIVPSGPTTGGFTYSTITITTAGIYLFEWLVEQAYTTLGSNNYITLNGTNAEPATNASVSKKYGWNSVQPSIISFQGSQVTTATASSYTLVVTQNGTYGTPGVGFFQATRLG